MGEMNGAVTCMSIDYRSSSCRRFRARIAQWSCAFQIELRVSSYGECFLLPMKSIFFPPADCAVGEHVCEEALCIVDFVGFGFGFGFGFWLECFNLDRGQHIRCLFTNLLPSRFVRTYTPNSFFRIGNGITYTHPYPQNDEHRDLLGLDETRV